jgi:hypothetical protein
MKKNGLVNNGAFWVTRREGSRWRSFSEHSGRGYLSGRTQGDPFLTEKVIFKRGTHG